VRSKSEVSAGTLAEKSASVSFSIKVNPNENRITDVKK
jgi:hypothetical protein